MQQIHDLATGRSENTDYGFTYVNDDPQMPDAFN